MNTTFENAQTHQARREERRRRLAELEAAYDAAITGNTRAFHERMDAAENHLLDARRHGDEPLYHDRDGEEGSAWLGTGTPPPDGVRSGFLTRAMYCIKAKRFYLLLAVMLSVAVAGIVVAFATPSKGRVVPPPSTGGNSIADTVEDLDYYVPNRAPPASQSRSDYFRSIIVGSKVSSEDALYDEESPQGRAYAWLLDDDSVSLYGGGERYEPGVVAVGGGNSADIGKNAVLIRYALAVLYYSTTSAHRDKSFDFEETAVAASPSDTRWVHSDLWLSSTTVCKWYGITCYGQYNEVGNPLFTSSVHPASTKDFGLAHSSGPVLISLNLTTNGLDGHVPPELFTGLGPSLRILDLSWNDLSGNIPSEIGHANSIDKLYLDSNPRLSGTIPRTLGTVSHLQYLYLNDCALSGAIPSEMGHLTRLRGLGLHRNALTGLVPASLTRLKDLYVLYLDENHLEGVVPSLSGLSNLADLRLRGNLLYGHLPTLPERLELAYLDNNYLTGSLPSSYGDLPFLTELHIHHNLIESTLPRSLGNLQDLTILYLDHNRFSSSIPSSFSKLTDLKALYLFDNNFTGTIEPVVNMTDLEHLRLSNNTFSGTISGELGNSLFKLEDLYLDHNSFHGRIPPTLGALSRLQNLRLEGNALTGKVSGRVCGLRSDLLQTFVTDCLNEVECGCCTQCA